jgi:hypothetical protein
VVLNPALGLPVVSPPVSAPPGAFAAERVALGLPSVPPVVAKKMDPEKYIVVRANDQHAIRKFIDELKQGCEDAKDGGLTVSAFLHLNDCEHVLQVEICLPMRLR